MDILKEKRKLSDYQTAQRQLDSSSTLEVLYDHPKVHLLSLYLLHKTHQRHRPASQHFTLEPPTLQSQHCALKQSTSQCLVFKPPTSQHSALQPPTAQYCVLDRSTSQCLVFDPPASQHFALQPPISQHSALQPPASRCFVFEQPALPCSALKSHVYINAGTPEVYIYIYIYINFT